MKNSIRSAFVAFVSVVTMSFNVLAGSSDSNTNDVDYLMEDDSANNATFKTSESRRVIWDSLPVNVCVLGPNSEAVPNATIMIRTRYPRGWVESIEETTSDGCVETEYLVRSKIGLITIEVKAKSYETFYSSFDREEAEKLAENNMSYYVNLELKKKKKKK